MSTERLLALAAGRASIVAPARVTYTRRQLYYAVWRAWPSERSPVTRTVHALRRLPRIGQLATRLVRRQHPPLTPTEFDELVADFCRRHGPLDGLIEPAAPAAPPAGLPIDMTAYGLPRLLLCQSNEIAQMLRSNRLHIELSCLVTSVAEYPAIGPMVAAMLERVPLASAYLLHDASPAGIELVTQAPARCDLPSHCRLRPLGLRPAQAQRMGLPLVAGQPQTVPAAPTLAPAETAWLAQGWSAEVAAIPPVDLLRALRRAILGPSDRRSRVRSLRDLRRIGFLSPPTPS